MSGMSDETSRPTIEVLWTVFTNARLQEAVLAFFASVSSWFGCLLGVLLSSGSSALWIYEILVCPTNYNSEGRCFVPGEDVVYHQHADVWLALLICGLVIFLGGFVGTNAQGDVEA